MSKKEYREKKRIEPIGKEGIEKCRVIMKEGYAKVNEVMVDGFSAGAIVGVYDAIKKPELKEKFESMCVGRAAEISFKLINGSR